MALAAAAAAALVAGPVEAEAGARPQVAGLQVALKSHGLYGGHVDAVLGPKTRRGVRAFQRREGLRVDGVAGRRTREALGRLGRPLFGKRVMRAGHVGWDVGVLQFLLRRHGFQLGAIDGGLGPRTDAAGRRFQRWAWIQVDGRYGPATAAQLRVAPNAPVVRSRVRRSLVHWARYYRIDPKLARALAWVESGFQPGIVSPADAWGVMQVMPGTWRFVETALIGRAVPKTPPGNIRVGLRYLRYLFDDFDGRTRRALAAYNQGPGALREQGMYAETRQFVRAVLRVAGPPLGRSWLGSAAVGPVRVLIADDQALLRGGFRLILDEQADIDVVGEASNGAEAIRLAEEIRPDVVLMDVRMPDVDGLEATRRLAALEGAPKVIMLTTFDTAEVVYEAMQAGASGFLVKDLPPEQLAAGIRTVAAGDALLAPTVTRRLIEEFVSRPPPGAEPPALPEGLTDREGEVLELIARGLSNAEIAAELVVTEATVKTHVAHVLRKLGLRDRVQAVVYAYESGLARPGA